MSRLATAPGVGPVTASAFVATIDDIRRFRSAHALDAYLGEVPSERSSGEKRQLGQITKIGNSQMRCLLVEAGWQILRTQSPETAALRAGMRIIAQRRGKRIIAQRRGKRIIAQRRGKRIAVVALARRLAGILFAMWQDGVPDDAQRMRPLTATVVPTTNQRAGKSTHPRARIELPESGAASA